MRNIVLLIFLIALAFSPCLSAEFLNWDDDLHLLNNPQTQTTSLSNTLSIFRSVVNNTYIPLTILSFNIEHLFFGLNPFIYHLNNLILHILTCLLIYQLFCRMGCENKTAFLGALLFGIHPMHVESVAWITERKDVLYSVFYIAGLISYCRFIHCGDKKALLWSICAGFLSLLAKPMALSYPLALLLLDWFFKRPWSIRVFLEKAPFIFFAPIVWMTYSLNIKTHDHPILESILIWIWSYSFYLKKFFFPVVLTPVYTLPYPISVTNPEYLLAIAIAVGSIWTVVHYRKSRWVLFAAGYYLLSIFFLLRTSDVAKNLGPSIVADRFMYLPSLGICLRLALAAADKFNKPNMLPKILLCCFIGIFGYQTFQQCRIWQNDRSLWSHELKHERRSPLAFNSYAVAISKKKDYSGALAALDEAIKLKPDYVRAYYNRGHINARIGRSNEALNDYSRSITLDPEHINSLIERGVLYSKLGELNRALEDLNNAEKLAPNNTGVFNNRGIIYKKLGQWENALNDYNRAIKLNPRSASTYVNRARVWQELGNPNEADKDLAEAQRLNALIGLKE